MPYNPEASLKAAPSNSAEKTFNSAMANMDRVLAKSNPGKNELVKAMDRLNSATDNYAKSVLNSLNSTTTVQEPPKTEPPKNEGFSGGRGASITATPPAPILNAPVYTPPPPPIKTATLDIILFDEESIPTV